MAISVRFRASSEESSPQAKETKISGMLLGGSSGLEGIFMLLGAVLDRGVRRNACPCIDSYLGIVSTLNRGRLTDRQRL